MELGLHWIQEVTDQRSPSHSRKHPHWQGAIEAALNEPDPVRLLERIYIAETAIFNRLHEPAQHADDSYRRAERQAIAEALKTLRILKRDKLGFPDWEAK